MDTIVSSLVISFVIWVCIYVLASNLRSRKSAARLPPGPYSFPIIGNLHQLGKKPHQSFAKLSRTYGPLMSLKLGSKTTILVSSATDAREVLQKYDRMFSSRAIPTAAQALDHHKFSWSGCHLPANGGTCARCAKRIFLQHQGSMLTKAFVKKSFKNYVIICVGLAIAGKL